MSLFSQRSKRPVGIVTILLTFYMWDFLSRLSYALWFRKIGDLVSDQLNFHSSQEWEGQNWWGIESCFFLGTFGGHALV